MLTLKPKQVYENANYSLVNGVNSVSLFLCNSKIACYFLYHRF